MTSPAAALRRAQEDHPAKMRSCLLTALVLPHTRDGLAKAKEAQHHAIKIGQDLTDKEAFKKIIDDDSALKNAMDTFTFTPQKPISIVPLVDAIAKKLRVPAYIKKLDGEVLHLGCDGSDYTPELIAK